MFPELVEFTASRFILANATAGINGGYVIVVPDQLVDDIVAELKSRGYKLGVFGKIVGKGEPVVETPKELQKYVVDIIILSIFKLV